MRLVALFSGQGVKKLDFSSFFLSEKNLKEFMHPNFCRQMASVMV